jgi:hypothetical protein
VGEIFAKLEVYLWLGITKYSKNCVTSLPAEFKPVYEEAMGIIPVPMNMAPIKLSCEGKSSTFTSDVSLGCNTHTQTHSHTYAA